MGNIAAINRLSPAQHATVDKVLLQRPYVTLTEMVSQLEQGGISISRSALHRYAVKLRKGLATRPHMPRGTLVTLVDLDTLKSTTLPIEAPAEALEGYLLSLDLGPAKR